jgi:hypothetical protein
VHNDELLQRLLEYIKLRRSLCNRRPVDLVRSSSQEGPQFETRTDRETLRSSSTKTSQALLSHIAWLSEEVVRASQEKVNVAQSAYDSVRDHLPKPSVYNSNIIDQADRQIRLLDFAIKEQETCIKFGPRPGTHLPIFSDAVVGRWVRPPREAESLEQALSDVNGVVQVTTDGDGVPNLGVVAPDSTDRKLITTVIRRGKKHKKKRKSSNTSVPQENILTVTLPPLSSIVLPAGDMPVDPHEPRYCYCNQVSFGEVCFLSILSYCCSQ